MACETLSFPGGGTAIICSRGRRSKRCSSCGGDATIRCDFPLTGKKAGKTCDRWCCRSCATSIGVERDLCPAHAREVTPKRHAEGESLRVWTGKMGLSDPDYLDITCQGNLRRVHRGLGIYFAPSPEILYPQLSRRKFGRETEQDWLTYVEDYTREMRASYRRQRAAWDELLSWERVVVLCFCPNALRCHRTVLARDILPKLGAQYQGEVGMPTAAPEEP